MMQVLKAFGVGALVAGLAFAGLGRTAFAQEQSLSALARLDPSKSQIAPRGQDLFLTLSLSQPVPWRVRILADPPRLILDTREVEWSGIDTIPHDIRGVAGLRAGVFRSGWSRLVLEMTAPMVVATAGMDTGGGAAGATVISVRLKPAPAEEFAQAANRPEPAEWTLPDPKNLPALAVRGEGPVIVVLDPGHGGLDPGAERGKQNEANLMLVFARELKDLLLRDGRFKVVMTRDDNIFVPLETRISVARKAGAHVFLSLHADALPQGEAHGATIYTLSKDASDEAARTLAERHERDDLLAGIDLSAHDDLVASVLMDMARRETQPRTLRLAATLESAIRDADLRMHRHPRQEAGFSVLKSPDIPSVLLELGFMSSERDLKRLTDPAWRAKMTEAIRVALLDWTAEDLTLRNLRAAPR